MPSRTPSQPLGAPTKNVAKKQKRWLTGTRPTKKRSTQATETLIENLTRVVDSGVYSSAEEEKLEQLALTGNIVAHLLLSRLKRERFILANARPDIPPADDWDSSMAAWEDWWRGRKVLSEL